MSFDQNYSERMRYENTKNSQYNGIAIINQPIRLAFYDQILKECKGKRCIDVGSGSGVLAFLALKHGAKHVTCFEQNPKSATHIQNVAKRMGLSKKIKVINTEFIASKFDSYDVKDIDILFHELVGSFIWNDMMGSAFDVPLPFKILPSEYLIKIDILKLPQKDYARLINLENNICIANGVNIDFGLSPKFAEYYNEVISSASHYYHKPHVIENPEVRNELRQIYESHEVENVGIHLFNINNPEHYKFRSIIQFNLPKTDLPYLIRLHPRLRCGDLVLDFKVDYTSFTGYYNPIVIPPNSKFQGFQYKIFENQMRVDKFRLK